MGKQISVQTLLEAGCHFGHQTKRWNPKMKPYIFGERNGIYIIDLNQTLIRLDRAYSFVMNLAAKGGTILFVGTKKQAQQSVIEEAERCGMPYIANRWLGGMLTNFVTIRSRVDRMEEIEAMREDGTFDLLPKKEQVLLEKEYAKLDNNLGGVRDMRKLPDAVFIIDTNREEIAVKESNRLDIPVLATIDTNSDPDSVDYKIPANDDAIRSVRLICSLMADAVLAGKGKAKITAEEMTQQPDLETQDAPASAEAVAAAPAAGAQEEVQAEKTKAPTLAELLAQEEEKQVEIDKVKEEEKEKNQDLDS